MSERGRTVSFNPRVCDECGGDRYIEDHSACDLASMKRSMRKLGAEAAARRDREIMDIIIGTAPTR